MLQDSRLFRIVYYLLDKGKCTAPELADKFEVSTRTIYRDLDVISAAGIPIYATQGKGGGISILPEYVMDNALLSDEEKEKIVMALQGIAVTDETTDDLLSKLGALFQTKAENWIEVDFSDWIKNNPDRDIFNSIKTAIFKKVLIDFSYFGNNGCYSKRTVEPIKLVFKSKDWYLYGFCRLRNDFRFFKLTRIKNLVLCEETFVRDVPVSLPAETSLKGESLISVKLKFSSEVSFRVYDEFTDGVVLSRVMRKYNSVTYEVGKAKAEQAAGMFGLAGGLLPTPGHSSLLRVFPDPSVPAISCSCSVLRPTECQ